MMAEEDDGEKLYTKADMLEISRRRNSPAGSDPASERKWTDEDFIRILTRAGQIKQTHMEQAGRQFVSDGEQPIVLSKAECEIMVREAIFSTLGQIGFPVRTDEERKNTIIVINNLKKLDASAKKFWGQVLAGIGAVVIAIVGPLFVWYMSRNIK